MRPEKIRSFLDSAALLEAWSPPALVRVPLTAAELSRIRSAEDPAAALKAAYISHKASAPI